MKKKTVCLDAALFTINEVAIILKTNSDYVHKLRKTGLLKFLKIGNFKVRKETLLEFLEKYEGFDLTNPNQIIPLEENIINQITETNYG